MDVYGEEFIHQCSDQSVGCWYGSDEWEWRRTGRYNWSNGDKRVMIVGADCPGCGEWVEMPRTGSVLEAIRIEKKRIEKEEKEKDVETECAICGDRIPKRRIGWSTCSIECGRDLKGGVG